MAADQRIDSEIISALNAYCRGIDRLDEPALLEAFHPDAELRDYGPEPMTVSAFASHVLPALERRFSATQHRISNTTIERSGDQAMVETYVLAFHVETANGDGEPDRLHTFNGRYIDRFETRGGLWLIATRTLRTDWSRVETIDEAMPGSWVQSGRAGSPDPIYDR